MRKPACVLALASTLALGGCLDDWLTTEPQDILTNEQLYSDPQLIVNLLADYYDRLPMREGPQGVGETGTWIEWEDYDEAIISRQNTGNVNAGGVGSPANYSYTLIRDIHIAMNGIEPIDDASLLGQKAQFLAELRFLRAFLYFDMVKRHGGVPLITQRMRYDPAEGVEALQIPRSSEAEVYDFIYNEMMAIKDDLPRQPSTKARATWGAAMALISRSQLYAGSIATHNNGPTLSEPLEVVDDEADSNAYWASVGQQGNKLVAGIPQSRAAEFYTRSLAASDSLISPNSGYSLLMGPDPSVAFHNNFVTKGHSEAIFVRDFASTKLHVFRMRGSPQSMRVSTYLNWGGSEIGATLNVVENFDRLDGTRGPLPGAATTSGDQSTCTAACQANWIFYDTPGQIFEGYDGRLAGTVLTPGGNLGGLVPQVQTGVAAWNGTRYVLTVGGIPGQPYAADPDFGVQVGVDGTAPTTAYFNNTGFWIKKYLNPDPANGAAPPGGDDTWVPYFRLGEIYMNATEAAFQLGQTGAALGYINELRRRAGFPPNSLTSLTMEKIQQERWSELAYEDHRLWDLRRWRIAHQVWDGNASNPSTRLWVISVYRVYRPGHATHGKWVFNRHPHIQNQNGKNFGIANYYSQIPNGSINNNPLLVQNSGFE